MIGPKPETGQTSPSSLAGSGGSGCLEIMAYRMLTRLARPAAPYILRLRERNGKEDPLRKGERLGRPSIDRPAGSVIWVHAASVGETSAILPIIKKLGEMRPDLTTLLTTGTVTSAKFAAGRLGPHVLHQYVPLDEPSFVGAFLDYWRPDLAIFTEQEVWPNLVLATAARDIPMALVNARMSDRSFERWQRRTAMADALFSRFDVVLAQNESLARRFLQIGARKVLAVGNLKIDAPPPPVDAEAFAALEAALQGRPRFAAASTHDGEEQVIATAHLAARARIDRLVALIAPRHPERGEAIATMAEGLGLNVRRRSLGELPDADTDVFVVDTIGELGTVYAAAPVAFVGGSLIEHGGQNPIEAVRHGAVVLTGRSTHNFADAYGALLRAGGATQVANAEDVATAVVELIGRPDAANAMRENAMRALQTLSGALDRSLEALAPFLPAGVDRRLSTGG